MKTVQIVISDEKFQDLLKFLNQTNIVEMKMISSSTSSATLTVTDQDGNKVEYN